MKKRQPKKRQASVPVEELTELCKSYASAATMAKTMCPDDQYARGSVFAWLQAAEDIAKLILHAEEGRK